MDRFSIQRTTLMTIYLIPGWIVDLFILLFAYLTLFGMNVPPSMDTNGQWFFVLLGAFGLFAMGSAAGMRNAWRFRLEEKEREAVLSD